MAAGSVLPTLTILTNPKEGHGEYVVFRHSGAGVPTPLSSEQYLAVYKILHKDIRELAEPKFDFVTRELRAIDPTYEVAFIPRVLYEMMFFHECIKEESDAGKPCELLQRHLYVRPWRNEKLLKLEQIKRESNRCWHLCHFRDRPEAEDDADLSILAHRLNEIIIRALFDEMEFTEKATSYHHLKGLLDREIKYFQEIYHTPPPVNVSDGDCSTVDSFSDHKRNKESRSEPMAVSPEFTDIVRNAFNLECSKEAEDNIILYRGSKHSNDAVRFIWNFQNKTEVLPRSLSYGLGLFSGGLYDESAAPFYYMKDGANDAFAYIVPKGSFGEKAPFSLSFSMSTPYQLTSVGEFFHARTKVWHNSQSTWYDGKLECPKGVYCFSSYRAPKGQSLLKQLYSIPPERVDAHVAEWERIHASALMLNRGPLPVSVVDLPIAPSSTLEAAYDTGYGNSLEVRGTGPGMSWTEGLPLHWHEGNLWSTPVSLNGKPFSYKLVLKMADGGIKWETGADRTCSGSEWEKRTLSFA